MTLRGLVIGVLLLGPAVASGDELGPSLYGPTDTVVPDFGFVGEARPDGLVLARQIVPTIEDDVPVITETRNVAIAQSRIIYLNKNGVTLSPGANDSRTNRSTIVNQQTAIAGWNVSATTWNQTVSCMRDLFAQFDVQIVDVDPGNVPHMEAVFGGTPTQVGMDPNVAGVSPFTLDCSIIENSVVFTFTNSFNFTAREACEIMAQEVAHSYGLDHELLASDPMTYLNYNGNRAFQDQSASCGESAARSCGINGSVCRNNQNSVQLLRERLGVSDPIAPTVTVTSPANNATVPPDFEVKATGADNIAITGAVLKIDGVQRAQLDGPGPFVFSAAALAEGSHTIEVEVSDGKNVKAELRNVTVKVGAPPPGDGTGSGTGNGNDEDPYGDVYGGCATGGGHGTALWALALGALVSLRRRKRR